MGSTAIHLTGSRVSVLLLLHAAAALLAPLLARYLGRRTFPILALVPAASFGWLLSHIGTILDGGAIEETITWVPSLGMQLAFRASALQWILALLVTGVGALVLFYCTWYFRPNDTTIWRFSSVFVLFAGAMLGLVISDNMLLMYVFWELTTVFSYLLVGHNPVRAANRRSAMQALMVTTYGGLAMLGGIVLIGEQSSYLISEVLLDPPAASALTTVGVLLLLLGALTKSAQIPFHFWLPGAMAAPTPVSAYLHAAAMVKAGIYLVAVLAPVFATTPGWRPITVGIGGFTMLVGGWRALRQTDIKLLLAYGTVSQLGFLTALAGIGTRASALAAVALVVAHALFKSALFLVVGIIDRTTGTRNLTKLTGLARRLPIPLVVSVVSGMSMAGIPPLTGFVAKEAAFDAALHSGEALGTPGGTALLTVLVLGSVLTVAYTARFIWGAFADKDLDGDLAVTRPSIGFQAAPVILAAGSLALGFAGRFETRLIEPYYATMRSGDPPPTLALWHGLNLPLLLSLLAVALGLALFVAREAVTRAQAKVPAVVDGERTYNAVMRFVDRSSVDITAVTQRGSLPTYLATILLVVVAFPGVIAVVAATSIDMSDIRVWDTPAQGGIALMVIVATLVGVWSRHRLRATILIGVSGMGAGLLFLVHGAPDLAITQISVETVTIVIFVLVLRRLPSRFTARPLNISRYWRAALAGMIGIAVAAIAVVTASARVATPVSVDMPQAAYDFGYGNNVVNVILVDIRAWDTFGEVSVLVVAATGIASLIFVQTRNTMISRIDHAQLTEDVSSVVHSWLPATHAVRPQRRSVIFEVITRLLFHAMIALSLYLLFVGHNMPGGGFAGGLVAGLALLVRYLAGGRYELDEAAPIDAGLLLGLGLFVAIVTAAAPMAFGGVIFQSGFIELTLPVWGHVKAVSALAFDIGVYLIVVGLMLDIGRSLGAGIDRQIEKAEKEQRLDERVVIV